MRLLLIRHGQTPSNVERILDAEVPGPPLTELGERQALELADALTDEPLAAIYASTMVRAQQTAAPLAAARDLEVRIRDGLREVAAGVWQGRNDEEAVAGYLGAFHTWSTGDLTARMEGAESGTEVLGRFSRVVEEIVADAEAEGRTGYRDPAVAIVSHGAMLRFWAGAVARNVSPEFVRDQPLRNTGLIELRRADDNSWHAERWMDHVADDAGALVPSGPLEASAPGGRSNPGF